MRRLIIGDLANFWAEGPTTPMHIALVGVLAPGSLVAADGSVDVARARTLISQRLFRAPQLMERIRWTWPGQGMPVWEPDPALDVARHVDAARTPPMSEAQFVDWCAGEMLRPFERTRPMWRITFVPRVDGRNVGVLVVVHHVVADGLRGVALIAGLLDDRFGVVLDAEDAERAAAPRSVRQSGRALVVDNLRGRLTRLRAFIAGVPSLPSRMRTALRTAREAMKEMEGHVPRTPLAVAIGTTRRLLVIRRALDAVRAAARARGVTLNDLVLSAVTTGMREWLLALHASVQRPLRVSVPMGASTSNAGSVMLVPLPVHEPNEEARIAAIHAFTRAAKQRHAADRDASWTMLLPWAPLWVSRLWVRWLRRFGRDRVNAYVTNVPGPVTPLYLGDAQLLSATPIAPLVAGVALSLGVFSYAGALSLAVHVDGGVPAPERLRDAIAGALDRLCGLSGDATAQPDRERGAA